MVFLPAKLSVADKPDAAETQSSGLTNYNSSRFMESVIVCADSVRRDATYQWSTGCLPRYEVISMQRFVAQLSILIEQSEFERSWHSDQSLKDTQPNVEFLFDGLRVSALVDSDLSDRWPSASFYRTFSAAVRRVDRGCNIRWI
jgi:hypothetical protein